jgi:hypothetical protein
MVVVLHQPDGCGLDEHTLPILLSLVDSASPNEREWSPFQVTGYFLTSIFNLATVADLIEQAKALRTSDARFSNLGIGLAEGFLMADFTLFGRLKQGMRPIGTVNNDAFQRAQLTDGYTEPLQGLMTEFHI